jgi:hypothetical protein
MDMEEVFQIVADANNVHEFSVFDLEPVHGKVPWFLMHKKAEGDRLVDIGFSHYQIYRQTLPDPISFIIEMRAGGKTADGVG